MPRGFPANVPLWEVVRGACQGSERCQGSVLDRSLHVEIWHIIVSDFLMQSPQHNPSTMDGAGSKPCIDISIDSFPPIRRSPPPHPPPQIVYPLPEAALSYYAVSHSKAPGRPPKAYPVAQRRDPPPPPERVGGEGPYPSGLLRHFLRRLDTNFRSQPFFLGFQPWIKCPQLNPHRSPAHGYPPCAEGCAARLTHGSMLHSRIGPNPAPPCRTDPPRVPATSSCPRAVPPPRRHPSKGLGAAPNGLFIAAGYATSGAMFDFANEVLYSGQCVAPPRLRMPHGRRRCASVRWRGFDWDMIQTKERT